jgi:hypothetical protein
MTRKDYNAIAAALFAVKKYDTHTEGEVRVLEKACNSLATVLKRDNSLFDRDRFMQACGFAYAPTNSVY